LLSILTIVAVRCLLIMLFLPFSALDKILNWKLAVGQAEQVTRSHALATLFICTGFGIEVAMSLAILTGIADRLAAFILASYCIFTAVMWKQFWKLPDFHLKGASTGRETFWDFLKNLGLAAGFLLLVFGTDAAGVRRFLNDPFASTHPYAVIDNGGSR
jgi:putative oxidoreductase